MLQSAPRALLENAGLAFAGERVARNSSVTDALAERMLGTRNPHGKPNADVLRRLVSATNPHRTSVHWQIDFPPTMGEREASLYEHPFHHLFRTIRPDRPGWWFNRHADHRLRAALARRERYLATPVGAEPPAFTWFESSVIPDDSLLAVARDDDWTHGLLLSRPFALWWRNVHSRRHPTNTVDTFPFPWPPGTELNALTAAQEEQRHAIARAARAGEAEEINRAVAAAYGWPSDLPDEEVTTRLLELNFARKDRTSPGS
jgi:hypothetical protein